MHLECCYLLVCLLSGGFKLSTLLFSKRALLVLRGARCWMWNALESPGVGSGRILRMRPWEMQSGIIEDSPIKAVSAE